AKDIVVVLLPGDDCAKVDKVGQVEKQVDDVGDVGLLRLLAEPAVVGEADAGGETDKQVVQAENAARAGAEESDDEVKDEEALAINQVALLGKLDAVAGNVSEDETVDGAEDAFV